MESINKLSELFREKYGFAPTEIRRLPGAGSGRIYYRLSGEGRSCIGVKGDSLRDCRAFLRLTESFLAAGVPVPKVYGSCSGGLYYIQEDLGDKAFSDLIKEEGESERVEVLIQEAFRELVKMQSLPEAVWSDDTEYGAFSKRQIFWDLNYFKYEYLRPSGIDFDEEAIEDDFEAFAGRLMEEGSKATGFMYRDFQSRNIMLKDGTCRFIDYQGGRKGPGIYDAVSFLWQAKAGFSAAFRQRMLEYYAEEYNKATGMDSDSIVSSATIFAFFRTLQVLGAYGLRGLVERKAHFIESIPKALANLREILESGASDSWPELRRVCERLIADPRFKSETAGGRLRIEVYSFSYKKGYPANYTGNGGGFIFDCRGMHNPGRYAAYKELTGIDAPVIEFLKEKGETDLFVRKAFELVMPTVRRYVKRGFTDLQIGFGCTGGQHRSVYCAQLMGELLSDACPEAEVVVIHREQQIRKELKGK